MASTLWAVSDLHVTFAANRERVARLAGPQDWLIVAGDVAEKIPDVVAALKGLSERFAKVIWVPGNHELFNRRSDRINGKARYRALVGELRALGIITPEDEFPVFAGVIICPLFTLYDYSFGPAALTVETARMAMDDEIAIAPYVDIRSWCAERVDYSRRRLEALNAPTILINHWPLVEEPTARLRHPDLALWCGTRATRDFPLRYRARCVIHGHLHAPAEQRVDGIPHIDVSLGYPFETHHGSRPWPVPLLER
ncbi:serine/threonine protein phosphatase [Corynebacterium yudongzhengii]|uniref:Metallophosphoesterase n=1 Tax=Corynebacterium yudongzhengii TaxID=2080740 RepID=A0A2U1T581_9CORY|nr:metallophosphoesterase [Corynebacterium yudongzhengii]AWB81719.1 serine/threonine protein phosphatase [Corynebacterium yudongzhengii]PWC01152.1 metallophosphoesterase [Corynebacterium yudongzhengii]